jgi:hypothetical protein
MIDGDRWIARRLAFLRELLQTDPSPELRQAIEAEIAVLSKERGIQHGGPRRGWIGRRWLYRIPHR